MCPNRFLPHYHPVKLYEQTKRKTAALTLARQILEKSVKVPSYRIEKIKSEMEEYVNIKNQIEMFLSFFDNSD